MRKSFTLLLVAVIFLSGCSMFGKGKKSGDDKDGQGMSEADLTAQREGRFAGGNIPTAEGEGAFRDVHFEYDSAAISDSARQEIESNVQALQANKDLMVQLEGHTDERGTAEYNLALGNKRARAVADVLVSFGVSGSRISTISYGEEVPLNPAHDEAAWAQNRRVHFSAFAEGQQ
ncbi:MAG: peptidoglycan-associated lipoprotein Pal [Deltaproteobacteria bacterium]|nr:peptidoglycan-associated lipoprotein Pal [Deltaproteobacteria bacterium]